MPTPTTSQRPTGVTLLGLGAMGTALAERLLDSGYPVTVWNLTPGRDTALVERGAAAAATAADAIIQQPLIIACLLRYDSVRETLDPVADQLRGRTLINFTTTTPNEARELAGWADRHGTDYLDGAILAVPSMIGTAAAQIFYSGSTSAFEQHREVLDTFATSTYDGADAGMASLIDLAMLSGMYQMFAGFFHGAAMVGSEGMTAEQFADRATPFISAMAAGLAGYAEIIDGGDYAKDGQQSLEFSDLTHLLQASEDQGVNPATIAPLQQLISDQIDAGHGKDGLPRVFEGLRSQDERSTAGSRT